MVPTMYVLYDGVGRRFLRSCLLCCVDVSTDADISENMLLRHVLEVEIKV